MNTQVTDRSRALRNDEHGNPPNPGVVLVLSEPGHFAAIANGSSRFPRDSWSKSANLSWHPDDQGRVLQTALSIANYGLSESLDASLRFVLWAESSGSTDLLIGTYAEPRHFKVPASPDGQTASTELAQVAIALDRVLWLSNGQPITSDPTLLMVTHVHALIADHPLDPPDADWLDFWHRSKRGELVAFPHIARLSRQVVCKSSPASDAGAFALAGNDITHAQRAPVEFELLSRRAGADASFGSPHEIWINALLHAPQRTLFAGGLLSSGQITFSLYSANQPIPWQSTDPARCRISIGSGHTLTLAWEDGADNDCDDYVLRVIHR